MSNFSISGFPLVDSDGDVVVRSITTDIVRFSFLGIGAEASKSYTYGGGLLGPQNFAYNQHNIETFPFAAESPIGEHADLGTPSGISIYNSGLASTSNGYFTGGKYHYGYGPWSNIASYNRAQKIPFANTSFSTLSNVLGRSRQSHSAHQSSEHGYTAGGIYQSPYAPGNFLTQVDKFQFSSETVNGFVGSLYPTAGGYGNSGTSSGSHGFISGGAKNYPTSNIVNFINKFPFSSGFNYASDIGDLSAERHHTASQSSSTHGYVSGGYNYPAPSGYLFDTIDKLSFSTDGNSTDIGNLTVARTGGSGSSSKTNGYTIGGGTQPGAPSNVYGTRTIDKFPFASDGDASAVGDLQGTGPSDYFGARAYSGSTQG